MATTTIGRATIVDSNGVAGVGDIWGSVLLGTAVYDKVDAVLAGAIELGSTLQVVGALRFDVSVTAAGVLLLSATAPTISSGFGTTPSISANNGTAAFRVDVGTGGTATAGVIGLPTAATGWNAHVANLTAQAANVADARTVVTASSTTSITVENQTVSTGAALAWTASDVLIVLAMAY
jgi:hypothetical protein